MTILFASSAHFLSLRARGPFCRGSTHLNMPRWLSQKTNCFIYCILNNWWGLDNVDLTWVLMYYWIYYWIYWTSLCVCVCGGGGGMCVCVHDIIAPSDAMSYVKTKFCKSHHNTKFKSQRHNFADLSATLVTSVRNQVSSINMLDVEFQIWICCFHTLKITDYKTNIFDTGLIRSCTWAFGPALIAGQLKQIQTWSDKKSLPEQ